MHRPIERPKIGRKANPPTPRDEIRTRTTHNFAQVRKQTLELFAEIFKIERNPAQKIIHINGIKRIRDLAITLKELKDRGCNAFNARQLGFTLDELVKEYTPMELIDAGFKPKEIVGALKKK